MPKIKLLVIACLTAAAALLGSGGVAQAQTQIVLGEERAYPSPNSRVLSIC